MALHVSGASKKEMGLSSCVALPSACQADADPSCRTCSWLLSQIAAAGEGVRNVEGERSCRVAEGCQPHTGGQTDAYD